MLTLAGCLFWFGDRSQPVRKTEVELGFEIITPGENNRFLPLELKSYTLDYLNDIEKIAQIVSHLESCDSKAEFFTWKTE